MKNVLVVALKSMMDSSFSIAMDTLRTAHMVQSKTAPMSGLRIFVVGQTKEVITGGGMKVYADFTFQEVKDWVIKPDWIIIPGLGMTTEEAISDRLKDKDVRGLMQLLRAAPLATRVGASCSSVFILAETGLLSGKPVTTTWWLAPIFRKRFPEVLLDETKMLAEDGRFLTAGSAFAQLDLALAVVTDLLGVSVAHLCSRYLLIDQRPSQARYMMPVHMQRADPTVVAAERWIDLHLSEPISVMAIASALAMSPKTFSRRVAAAAGISPLKLVQRRRLITAVHLIETTPLSIDAVAAKVGYQDGTALRKIIKRELATVPSALRANAACR